MVLDRSNSELLARLFERLKASTAPNRLLRARSMTSELAKMSGAGPAMSSVEDYEIETVDGRFPVRVLLPTPHPRGVLVYYHGGGWFLGNIDEFDAFTRTLAHQTGCAVVNVGYRLAPEHPYPTAIDDAWAAAQWTAARVEAIAGRPVPLILAGDSAGGNLAAVICQRANAAGAPHIALQVLAYPITDSDLDTASYRDPRNQLLLRKADMVRCWDMYCPATDKRTQADVAPLRADDLRGLPPAVVITAGYDVLLNEGCAYASRLVEAGVVVHRRHFEDQMHGFLTLVNLLQSSSEGIAYIAQVIGDICT
jgi:acetyl esterase